MALMQGKQIESMKEQYKYDKANHRLWYEMAQVYDRSLKDKKSAEQCLEIFLKTKPKEAKEQPAVLNNKGEVEADIKNYYNAAENWLNDLRNERKKENFFKDGAPKGSWKRLHKYISSSSIGHKTISRNYNYISIVNYYSTLYHEETFIYPYYISNIA